MISQSVGSRGVNSSSGPLNSTSQSYLKNGETHIKLLVRIRPTLSSESAVQCISLQKASTDQQSSIMTGNSSVRDTSLSLSRKKGLSKSAKSEMRVSDTQKIGSTKGATASPSIIKLTKGYNNISFKFDQVLPEGCSQDNSYQLSSS